MGRTYKSLHSYVCSISFDRRIHFFEERISLGANLSRDGNYANRFGFFFFFLGGGGGVVKVIQRRSRGRQRFEGGKGYLSKEVVFKVGRGI